MDVQLPDGTLIQGVPEGTTKAQLAQKLQANGRQVPQDWLKPKEKTAEDAFRERDEQSLTRRYITNPVGETALKLGSATAGAIAGGVRGVYDLVTGAGIDKASEDVQSTQQALTREPRTREGQAVAGVAEKPFAYVAGKADQAGEAVSRVTGSPALGAAANTTIQAAPALIGKVLGRGATALGRAAGASEEAGAAAAGETASPAGAPRGTAAKPSGPRPGDVPVETPTGQAPAPGAPLTATGQPRPPMSDVGGTNPPAGGTPGAAPGATPPPLTATGAPRGPMTEPPGGTPPQGPPNAPQTPGGGFSNPNEARAAAYAQRIGLDWTRLGAGTRAALSTIAQDSAALDRLDPAAVRRQAHLQSQRIPVPATRAQLTLDPVDARREAIVARTGEGARIREVDQAANAAVQGNLEALRGRVGGLRGGLHEPVSPEGVPAEQPSLRAPTKTATQVGAAKQTALREKEKWSKKGYQALYKRARETEPTAEAAIKPVAQLLENNPEIQHLGWVESWMSKAGRVARTEAGADPEGPITHVTLNELHDLRSKANDIARTGGKEGYYAGQVVKAIDAAMEDVPEGAKAWKAANDAFRKHQREFNDQGAVRQLVQNKKGGDPTVAHEKTWNKVATGSLAGLKQVKQSLLTGGTAATRMAGKRAWRDFRAETVNRILEDARNVTSTDPQERAILTAAALRRSINRVPRENLEEILGKANTRELYGILRSREITRGRTTESGTVPNMLVMAEKLLGHLPVPGVSHLGKAALGAVKAAHGIYESGRGAAEATEALRSPLEQVAEDVSKSRPNYARERRAAQYRDIERQGPTLPPDSIGAAIPPRQP